MIKAIRTAIKYQGILPLVVDLIEEVQKSVRDDGTISRDERSRLMKKFWAVVREVQGVKK
jgi:hypothetical protein|tara:strand:+ start:1745 stop:1924 length:180 start_codon:yes stop_codon:yes gene_type:complete